MRGGNGVALMGRFFTSMLFFLEIRLTFCAYETRLRFMIDLDIQKQFEQERSTHDSSSDLTGPETKRRTIKAKLSIAFRKFQKLSKYRYIVRVEK